jgi:phytoene synthase
MAPTLGHSFAWCERVARREAANFYHAFRLLPRRQRLDMCALYAFLRVSDDLVDAPGSVDGKRQALNDWRRCLDAALADVPSHPLHPALCDTVRTHAIPHKYLHAALDGVAMDLDVSSYNTFDDLYLYCYRVASVVGLSCIHIWGCTQEQARKYAESAGIAFQLTNILRDLAEDAGRGRVYLPAEDLERFGYRPEQLCRGERDAHFEALMHFEAERTRRYYDAAAPLVQLLAPPGRAVFLVMLRTYRGLLDAMVRCHFDVFARRVRVSRCYKLWQVLKVLPVRWGLASGVCKHPGCVPDLRRLPEG